MTASLRPDSFIQFIRTPRYLWPFNSAASAFWPPLGFCSLAAALRDKFPKLRVSVLDCAVLKIGWMTLERMLRENVPDVVCIGEETVSSREGLRLARLVKEINPRTTVIAGGVFFSYRVEETFAEGAVDYIVCGEGERTLVELVAALMGGKNDLSGIPGLAYHKEGHVRRNPSRPPILDLDGLPWPAYDLLPVGAYGRASKNHPNLASLEHSRGCVDRCSFCILWKHFGEPDNGSIRPCYRTKSPERSFEEVAWLARRYGRKTIHFVDPCFNADPAWSDGFAQRMLASGLKVQFTAWMRADFVVRDEKLGVLEKMVRAGLCQTYIGIERLNPAELAYMNKHNNGPEMTRKAFEILRSRYPEVFTIGTTIYGLPWESKKSLAELRDLPESVPLDYVFHIPLAPNPGTEIRQRLEAGGYRMSEDFREYNFFTPVVETDHLSRRELENFYSSLLFRASRNKLKSIRGIVRENGEGRRCRVYRNLVTYALKAGARQLVRRLLGPLAKGPTLYGKKPAWYDS